MCLITSLSPLDLNLIHSENQELEGIADQNLICKSASHLSRSSDTDKQLRQAWGGEDGERELETEEKAKADAAQETGEAAAAASAPNGEASEKPAPIEEEPDNTKTYDEYLAEQLAKKATLGGGAKEARTAADEENWKNFSVTKAARDDSEYFASTLKVSLKSFVLRCNNGIACSRS